MDASPSPPSPPPPSAIEQRLNPGVVLLIAILAMVFFIFGLLNLLVHNLLRLRRARRRQHRVGAVAVDGSPTAFQGQLQQLFHLHDAGVDQAFIDALPVFLYRNVVGTKDPFDCAVCLCEFEPDDQLRLLPRCSHAFHLECIDTWLLSHSTCPICRRSLLAELEPTCTPVVMVLESDSARDMAASAARATTADADANDAEPSGGATALRAQEEEVQVEVKLGKFMCVEASANAAGAADGAGTSGDANGDPGLGQRRCHSMGSYEYVMDDRASLHVAIKPPNKKKPEVSKSRRRGAVSECEFGASKRGDTSLRLPFPATTAAAQKQQPGAKLAKDSFSVSKIWMVPSSRKEKDPDAAGERRAVSFRWPVSKEEEEEENGKNRKSAGSEADWDVEAGSCGGNSVVSSLAEERPSFARRTLLWVVGGRQQSSRVGSCS